MIANVDLVKKFYSSFKANDKQTYLQMCADNIEWTVMDNMPCGCTYIGKTAVFEKYFQHLFSNFHEFHAMPEEFLDAGEVIVVLGKYQIVTKKSRETVMSPFAHVYTIKNEKIIRFRQYTDTVKIQNAVSS
ncbi:nuclear transport factor 2 family protein [Candidatus Nitrosotenuis sp. DW1]|uniref:nuclear transport factor 2 family protein n=1 Tax=Candidatus Nitrosotenuis sp. DW1 TaxID=2259672 RepID=UPI0015C95437|nr:nuclear transport factor 2 family protein [Candidatus Nitrosotenuis sp. DW1]QLH09639.1 ketosteroid isomerase [Candidatus Nitrosotenuis sp. DW1]